MDSLLGKHKKPTKIGIVSSAAFVKDFKPPDYLIEDIIIRGFVYSMTGQTGAGKTAVALRLSAHVALGKALLPTGPTVMKGRVLYFAGENYDDVKMRWIKLAQEMSFDPDTIQVDFFPGRCSLKEFDEAIANYADGTKEGYALVIIDTSQAFFQGTDENSRTEMKEHAMDFRALSKIKGNPAVITLCHPIKNWVRGMPLNPSGGGSFMNEIDTNLTIQSFGSSTVVEIYFTKIRGVHFEKVFFELISGTHDKLKTKTGKKITTVFSKPVSKAIAEQKRNASDDKQDVLLAAMADGAVRTLDNLAVKCGWYNKKNNPNKQLVERLLKALPAGLASKPESGGHWKLTKKGLEEAKRAADRPL